MTPTEYIQDQIEYYEKRAEAQLQFYLMLRDNKIDEYVAYWKKYEIVIDTAPNAITRYRSHHAALSHEYKAFVRTLKYALANMDKPA